MAVDSESRVVEFAEKPAEPKTIPDDSSRCLASMGIYVFSARFLYNCLCDDASTPGSRHDFGADIIPHAIRDSRVFAFPFLDENRKREAYWRDVGTLDAYFDANMDLVEVDPLLNLYDRDWPIRSFQPNLPPPKFVFGATGMSDRRGEALDSIVCQGAILSGGSAKRCVIGPGVRINSYSDVAESILFDDVNVGRHCRIRRAIVDKGVSIPPGTEIGYDLAADQQRGWTVTDSGIVVIARGETIQ